MPTWLIEGGYRFGMVAADCVEAPHVHVRGHSGTAKVWLGPVRLARMRGYNLRRLTQITRIVGEHEDEFLERWHELCRPTD